MKVLRKMIDTKALEHLLQPSPIQKERLSVIIKLTFHKYSLDSYRLIFSLPRNLWHSSTKLKRLPNKALRTKAILREAKILQISHGSDIPV
jgi:hypothetical protein